MLLLIKVETTLPNASSVANSHTIPVTGSSNPSRVIYSLTLNWPVEFSKVNVGVLIFFRVILSSEIVALGIHKKIIYRLYSVSLLCLIRIQTSVSLAIISSGNTSVTDWFVIFFISGLKFLSALNSHWYSFNGSSNPCIVL